MLLVARFFFQWSHLLVGLDSGVTGTNKIPNFESPLLCLSSESRSRLCHSFRDYVALVPCKRCQDVGTQVIEAVCKPPMHLRQPFQPFKNVGDSLPSPQKALSFNSATTISLAAGCYWVSSMARYFIRWDGGLLGLWLIGLKRWGPLDMESYNPVCIGKN